MDLQLNLPEFDLFPRLYSLAQHGRILVLIMQLLHNLSLINPIRPPEVPRILRPSLECQHMIELILGWSPKGAIDGKLEFLSPAPPVIIKQSGKLLEAWLLHQLLVLALQETHKPTLAARKHWVSPRLALQLDQHALKEVLAETEVVQTVLIPYAGEEEAIDLGELVDVSFGQVEIGRKADILRSDSSKSLPLGQPRNDLNLRHNDLLLVSVLLLAVRLMQRKESISGLQGLKHLQVGNNFEGLGGIKLVLDASHLIQILQRVHPCTHTSSPLSFPYNSSIDQAMRSSSREYSRVRWIISSELKLTRLLASFQNWILCYWNTQVTDRSSWLSWQLSEKARSCSRDWNWKMLSASLREISEQAFSALLAISVLMVSEMVSRKGPKYSGKGFLSLSKKILRQLPSSIASLSNSTQEMYQSLKLSDVMDSNLEQNS